MAMTTSFERCSTNSGTSLSGRHSEPHGQPAPTSRFAMKRRVNKDDNEAMITEAGIRGYLHATEIARRNPPQQVHRLDRSGQADSSLDGLNQHFCRGIFGHSNVGHVVWDEGVAQRFLDYWDLLAADDVTRKPLVDANLAVEPIPAPQSASAE